jgi:hypothetical protein
MEGVNYGTPWHHPTVTTVADIGWTRNANVDESGRYLGIFVLPETKNSASG